MDVDLGGLDGLMTQPKCDHGDVYSTMKKVHRRGVSECVRRHSLTLQRGTRLPGALDVPGDEPLEGVGTHGFAAGGLEDRRCRFRR